MAVLIPLQFNFFANTLIIPAASVPCGPLSKYAVHVLRVGTKASRVGIGTVNGDSF